MSARPARCQEMRPKAFLTDHVHRCESKDPHRGPHRCKTCGKQWWVSRFAAEPSPSAAAQGSTRSEGDAS